jgi:hypothetical protein
MQPTFAWQAALVLAGWAICKEFPMEGLLWSSLVFAFDPNNVH